MYVYIYIDEVHHPDHIIKRTKRTMKSRLVLKTSTFLGDFVHRKEELEISQEDTMRQAQFLTAYSPLDNGEREPERGGRRERRGKCV